MSIQEQQLQQKLSALADLTPDPRFTTGALVPHIRRYRRRAKATIALASVVIAAAVGIPVALAGTGELGGGSHSAAPARPLGYPSLAYTVTVNRSTVTVPENAPAPRFAVTAGERLAIMVDVTVPTRTTATSIWLGITNGVLGGRASMHPVLGGGGSAALGSGHHEFTLHWVVPAALRPGSSRQLELSWAWSSQVRVPGEQNQFLAVFTIRNGQNG